MSASLPQHPDPVSGHDPFELNDDRAYQAWRTQKLADYPAALAELRVLVEDGFAVRASEHSALLKSIRKTNMALYQLPQDRAADKNLVRQLGRQFGLQHLDNNLCADEDGISSLCVVENRRSGEYIPYTRQRLNWHTDGYYNPPDRQIRAVILQCVHPAENGGENAFLDHEIAYIQLRDENPAFILALMAPDAMTIPANIQQGEELRPEQAGPVFSVDDHGGLHMRYSARGRHILWKDDPTTRAAADYLLNLFQEDSPYIFRHRLAAGQGVISNNVLHCRTAFSHDTETERGRLLYRARYFERITNINQGG